MKFTVDLQQCENHGQCTIAAPDTFSLDDDGLLSFRRAAEDEYSSGELESEQADQVAVAVDMCPMQAITLG